MLVRGIMTLRLTHLHIAAAALAVAALSLGVTPAGAFSMESVNASGGANYADGDGQVNSAVPGRGYQTGLPGNPSLQFGQGAAGMPMRPSPYGFGATPQPPLPYAKPPGFGD
jgi:hypothetical protein